MTVPNRIIKFWFLFVPTVIILYLGLLITIWFRYPNGLEVGVLNSHLIAFSVIYVFWLLSFFGFHLFEQQTLVRPSLLVQRLVSAMLSNTIVAIVYFYIQPNLILTPRRFLLVHVLVVIVMLLIWYGLLKLFLKRTLMIPVYVLSVNDELRDLEHIIKANGFLGFEFRAHLKPEPSELVGLKANSVVIVPETFGGDSEVWKWLYELRNQGIRVINHKRFYEDLNLSVYLPTLNELWFLENVVYKDNGFYKLIKRLVDIFFGLIGFTVFAITYPFIAVVIKLNSRGPVFFKQPRVGQHGKPFYLIKYRTMKSGSATNIWTADGDVRIAGFVGKMLRKLRLDELPQSINILKGEMSLVGPRPEQVNIVEDLKLHIPFYNERHSAKPGLTGWAQLFVYAGTLEESRRKLEYDLYYIKHRSLWFDFEIILKTVNSVLTGSGK